MDGSIKKVTAKDREGNEREFHISSGSHPQYIDDIRIDVYYPVSRLSSISTLSGRRMDEALKNHPNSPSYDTSGPTYQGKYYSGEKVIRFYELLNEAESKSVTAPPWISATDKQAEHADIVARIMNELEPHISNAIRKVLFEETNKNA